MRDLPKCSPYLHVPAQSGSNAVLARMKRGYTVEDYREMMGRIRATLPRRRGDQRFHRRLLRRDGRGLPADRTTWSRECRFKNSFIFKYSERPGTKGAELLSRRRARTT